MKKLGLYVLFVSFLLAASVAGAQNNKPINHISDELQYTELSNALLKIEKELKKDRISSSQMTDSVRYIGSTRVQLEGSKKKIENDIKFVEKRVEALGDAPEDGQEMQLIAEKRKEFRKELSAEKARLSEVDILLTKLDELESAIFNLRNKRLWGNLTSPSDPLIYPSAIVTASGQFLVLAFDIIKSPVLWYESLNEEQVSTILANLIPVSFVMLFITFAGWWLRRFIIRRLGYRADIEHPRFGRKIFAAIMVCIAYGVIPTLIVFALLAWIVTGQVWAQGFFGGILKAAMYYSLYMIMGNAFCRVIFTPYNEKWRLINISTYQAKRLIRSLYLSVILVGITAFLIHVVKFYSYQSELISFLVAISSTLKAFCIVWIVHRFLWDGYNEVEVEEGDDEEDSSENEVSEETDDTYVFRVTFFSVLLALGIAGLSFFGYPYLAQFITDRFILSVIVVGLLFGARRIAYELLHRVMIWKFWLKTFRMRRRMLRKVDFWSGFLIDPFFGLGGLFALLALWGVPTDMLRSLLYRLFTGFTVGTVKISLISIVLGFFVLFISIAIVKSLRQRIENNLLSRMDIDEGTRHSLAAGFSSLGYVASALLAIAIMGGNLTNFALVAGALSFGVGLGLQNVVSNFVSGIILLFERPIKVGDWIIVNGQEGVVKQINIRSTELQTWKKASIIIPNSDLLSSVVTNLTHGDRWGRVDVHVGVAYGSDIDKVTDVLLASAADNKKVLKKPAPYTVFANFGESSLEFELRCYTADVMNSLAIASEMRYEINRRFIEAKIEIPFPQRVMHVSEDTLRALQKIKPKG